MEFVGANAGDKSISYVVRYSDGETTEHTPSLILYSNGIPTPFDPPGVPGTPTASKVTARSIDLKWTAPRLGGIIQSYQVHYGPASDFPTKHLRVESSATSCTISDLAPNVSYTLQVFAVGADTGDYEIIVKGEPCEITTEKETRNSLQTQHCAEAAIEPSATPLVSQSHISSIREVLLERERLETSISKLQEQISISMMRMEKLQHEGEVLSRHSASINAYEGFTYSVEATTFRKVKSHRGIYTTTCQDCKFTCHDECTFKDTSDCCVMKDSYCTACPKLCHSSRHIHAAYLFKYHKESVISTSDGLKQAYDSANSGVVSAEAMMAENEQRQSILRIEIDRLIDKSHQSSEQLKEIASDPDQLTESKLFDYEKQEANYFGWR